MTLLQIYKTPHPGMPEVMPFETFNMSHVVMIDSFDPRHPRLGPNESGFTVYTSAGKKHHYNIENFIYKYKVLGKEDV